MGPPNSLHLSGSSDLGHQDLRWSLELEAALAPPAGRKVALVAWLEWREALVSGHGLMTHHDELIAGGIFKVSDHQVSFLSRTLSGLKVHKSNRAGVGGGHLVSQAKQIFGATVGPGLVEEGNGLRDLCLAARDDVHINSRLLATEFAVLINGLDEQFNGVDF